jgi:hypothetical protein
MPHVEPGDALSELREWLSAGRDCACKHPDARACYAARYPDDPGGNDDCYCECHCHDEKGAE